MNLKNYYLSAILCLLGCYLPAQAQYLKDAKAVDAHTEEIMQAIGKFDFKTAFQTLKQYSIIEKEKLDELQTLTTEQLTELSIKQGKIERVAFVKDIKIKDFLVKKVYALLYEEMIIQFQIIYYQNSKGWTMYNFKYNDKIHELIEVAED